MAINFVFDELDEKKVYADSKAQPLVNFIIEHMDFLPYLCDCIVTYTSVDCLSIKDEEGEDMFLEHVDNFEFDDDNNYQYIDEFVSIFKEAYDVVNCQSEYEYEQYLLKTTNDVLSYEEFCKIQLGYIRGRVVELILEHFIEKRYKPSRTRANNFSLKFAKGCKITLKGKELICGQRKTVDIAGWDGSMGEFYEAKVNPDRFNEEVLGLLTLIKNELEYSQIEAIVGCISMKDKDAMNISVNKVINEQKISYNNNIQLYGKDELANLLYNRPDIIVA